MKVIKISLLPFLILPIFLFSCNKKNESFSKEYIFDFSESMHGWDVLFSDYPAGEENFYELSFEHTGLPSPLDNSTRALKVNGNNHSDDLLSCIYRKIDGLEANTRYDATFSIELASNACRNCFGAGGSPDLSLGAGGLSFVPANKTEMTGSVPYNRPNFPSELQSHRSNNTLKVMGTIGVGDGSLGPYEIKRLINSGDPITLTTNASGELWLLIGTDSGFEGITCLYYKKIMVVLNR